MFRSYEYLLSSGQKGQIISILYVTNNLNEILFNLMKNIASAQGLADHCEPILAPPNGAKPTSCRCGFSVY